MIEKQDHGFVFVKKRIRIIGCSQQAKEEKTAVCAAGEVHDSLGATAATPTITRHNGVNTAVSKNSISKSYKNYRSELLIAYSRQKKQIRKTS